MMTALNIKSAGLALSIAMLACFGSMTVFWVRVAQVGPFSLEVDHVGLLLLILTTVASIYSSAAIFRVVVFCAIWFLAFVAYLVLLIPAVAGTSALSLLFKQFMFVTGFVCVAAYFLRTPDPAKSLRLGALLGIVMYILFTEFSAQLIGKSLISAVLDFLGTGSFKAIIYGFFRPVFNSLEDATDLTYVASLTNSIAVSLLVLSVCYRAGTRKAGIDVAGTIVTVLVILLVIILNSRSVVIAGVAGMIAAFAMELLTAKCISRGQALYWVLGIVAISATGVAAVAFTESAVDSILEVFQFADSSAESRLEQYDWAFALIEERMLLGHGYVETDTGLPIHNIFLSAWAYTGIVGLLLILVFYIGIVAAWLCWLYRVVTKADYWVLGLRVEWVAVLPILPLFRVWISGAGGLPAYGEWVALGVFFGLVMRNELERARSFQPEKKIRHKINRRGLEAWNQ